MTAQRPCQLLIALAVLLCFCSGTARAENLLTTQTSATGPTVIVDGTGKEIIFNGIGWYGFNLQFAAPENLSQGVDSLSKDLETIVYKQKQLGLNSVRLAFAFDDNNGIRVPIVNYTEECTVPSIPDIAANLYPNTSVYSSINLASSATPHDGAPVVQNDICNYDMPNNYTYDRFIWVVNYYLDNEFFVNLDFHSNLQQDASAQSNYSFADQGAWIDQWSELLTAVLQNENANGRLLIDLINEPDGFGLTWEGNGTANTSLTSYYVNAIDALYEICPGCLFLVEGTGQYHWCGINWGNGFMTNQSIIQGNPAYNISDATPFFNAIMGKSWLNQVVLAPHIYCPGVTGAIDCFSGQPMFDGLDESFGYLTVSPGWCSGGSCHVFPAILDEFGSTLNNTDEIACMQSIATYANAMTAPSDNTTHAPLKSWFFWAWQPDSQGTGGLVEDDWKTVQWDKIGALTGGTPDFPAGFGLQPWYLQNGVGSVVLGSDVPVTDISAPAAAPTQAGGAPTTPGSVATEVTG